MTKGFGLFRKTDIGIDLGTTNTLVYVTGKGIILNEPSVVAFNKKTGQVVAVGTQAREMLGRTPAHIEAIHPLVEGVISDFEVAEQMLAYYLKRAREHSSFFFPPRVLIGVPSGITNVEIQAVRDATKNAGARGVFITEEPLAAALGIGLPVLEASATIVVDIGGGTTDIAVISLGGIVLSKNVRIAGDHFNQDIIRHLKEKKKLLIGERTAERIKKEVGSILDEKKPLETTVGGRDLVSGLPKEVTVTDKDVKDAMLTSLEKLIEAIKNTLETLPPEVSSDIYKRGVYLVGGGALIHGLDTVLTGWMKVPFYVADDPMTAVVRGTGIILENFEDYQKLLITPDEELPTPTE